MKNEQILKKAIEKAKKNGWDAYGFKNHQVVMGGIALYEGKGDFVNNERNGNLYSDWDIVFSHDFAKAFWGDELYVDEFNQYYMSRIGEPLTKAQYHLQQMVLEEEPIKYLGKFL